MRQGLATVLGLVLALCSVGCRSCALVESQLAARESDVRTLKEQLSRAEFLNEALSKELSALRGVPGPDGLVRPPTEPYPVRSLRLGNLTSARPSDVLPGDDALQVQLEPLDTEKQAIKAPGSARIVALEVTEGGNKRILSMWDVPPEELRNSWQNGLFNTGYVLTFKLKELPNEARLRVAVAFRMADGRVLEADKDIPVRPVPAANRPRTVPGPYAPPPLPPVPGETPPSREQPPPMKEAPPPMPLAPGPAPIPEGPSLTGGARPAASMLKPVPLMPE